MSRQIRPRGYRDDVLAALALRVAMRLSERSATVATAESCTGGYISKVLTDVAGSSAWFTEGFVTYSNGAKTQQLGVAKEVLLRRGAVSEEVARLMARSALERAHTGVAVAVTGIAGPGGAVPGKPVGTVWIAWVAAGTPERVISKRFLFRGDRDLVRRKTVKHALEGLLRLLG